MPGSPTTPERSVAPGTRARRGWGCIAFLVLTLFLSPNPVRAGTNSVLRDYVQAPDPVYGFRQVRTVRHPGCAIHILNMTSQRWRTHTEVNHILWSHWLAVVVPDGVRTDAAMVIVEGGWNVRSPPSLHNVVVEAAESIALATKTTVVAMGEVPNEPLYFRDLSEGVEEDELVAYTWWKAMNTGDFTWPAYVPMVKSVVRAMDAVQEFMAATVRHPVRRFVLVGFSKRAAATWLTAAVDARVMAFAAGVFDVLDIVNQLDHDYAIYGKYPVVMRAYAEYGLIRRLRSPEGVQLLHVVDPYFYRDAICQPKLLLNATGDPFFPPDAALRYVGKLHGETLLRYFPNASHSLANRKTLIKEIVDTLTGWYATLLTGKPRPTITWSLENGELRVKSDPVPLAARLWQASNPKARDFREETVGDAWTAAPLVVSTQGEVATPLAVPSRGWRAYLVELDYLSVARLPQVYSSPVFVQPDTLPYAVVDPVHRPRDAAWWKNQVHRAFQNDYSAEVGAQRLASYLPLPVFGEYIEAVAGAERLMSSGDDPADQARRECFATRLNIARHRLGWYSRLDLDGTGERYLWQYYQTADRAFREGFPFQARDLCAAMNNAGRAGVKADWPGG